MKTIKLMVAAFLLLLPLASQAQYFQIKTNSCPNPTLTISGISGDIVVSVNGTGSNNVMQYSTCKIWTTGAGSQLNPGQSMSVPLQPNTTYGILVMCLSDCGADLEATTTTNPLAINPSFTFKGKPGKGQPASDVTITLMDNNCIKRPVLQNFQQLSKTVFAKRYKPVLKPFKKLP